MRSRIFFYLSAIILALALFALQLPFNASTARAQSLPLQGVNLAGLEFTDNCKIPATLGTDYFAPDTAEIDYYIGKGMNVFRLPFCWERLQPPVGGVPSSTNPFDTAYLNLIKNTITYAAAQGATVILDPHNYAAYNGMIINSTTYPTANDFAAFWAKLANEPGIKNNSNVQFGLMNEPLGPDSLALGADLGLNAGITTEDWVDAANAAITAIRTAGANNRILVSGNAFSGAHSWESTFYGTPNAVAMLNITDPNNNIIFEVHQYFDKDYIGAEDKPCLTANGERGPQLVDFTNWLRTNGHKGFMGEFGVPIVSASAPYSAAEQACLDELAAMLQYMKDNSDVWEGWTYWAGGPNWGNYALRLTPGAGNTDRPQMDVLEACLDDPTLISLASFDAVQTANGTRVAWTTAAEIDNAGFNLYRSQSADGPWTKLNTSLIPAQGLVSGTTDYALVDNSGATYYMLEDVDTIGLVTRHGPVAVGGRTTSGSVNGKLFLPIVY